MESKKRGSKANTPTGFVARLVALREDVERFLGSESRKRANGNDGIEDQTQRVFATAVEKEGTFNESSGELRKWTLGIAANVAREDDRTKRRHDARFSADDEAVVSAACPSSSPERLAHWRDMQRKVLAAMEEMSPVNFDVLLLVGLHGRSHEEAAEKLGISVTVAKKRLERARKFLKERTGISDDDFRCFMPLLFLGESEETSRLERWREVLAETNPGGNALGAIIIGLVLSTSPPPSEVSIARAGLAVHPLPTFADMCPETLLVPIDRPTPQLQPAKPWTPRRSAAFAPREAVPAHVDKPKIDKIDIHPSRSSRPHRTGG